MNRLSARSRSAAPEAGHPDDGVGDDDDRGQQRVVDEAAPLPVAQGVGDDLAKVGQARGLRLGGVPG
jgi:hypothetical protein